MKYKQLSQKYVNFVHISNIRDCIQTISEQRYQHIPQPPSLYTGFVTPVPIEVHNDLMSQPKLIGPALLYRTTHKIDENYGHIPIYALPIQSVEIKVDICLETAYIQMHIIFINNVGDNIKNALFTLPMIDGTVSKISACIGNHDVNDENRRVIKTQMVNSEKVKHKKDNDVYDDIFSVALDDYICDLFRLPIPQINEDESTIRVHSEWQQTLEYNEGRYHLNIPLRFAQSVLPNNVNLNEIIHINVVLNSLLSPIRFGSNSHNLVINQHTSKQIHLTAFCCENDIESKDFHLAYYTETSTISGSAYVDEENQEFLLYINPITNSDSQYMHRNSGNVFGRDIIFLVDRSGSMNGSSHSKVIQALNNALDMLSYSKYNDTFGIVMFNEMSLYFHGGTNIMECDEQNGFKETMPPKYPLFPANPYYIENAKRFAVSHHAEGGTNFVDPLKWSLSTLNDIYCQKRANSNSVRSIPFIVLITDGSDLQEKEIINHIVQNSDYHHIRILTFGIGKYCNASFLNLLSLMNRGWHDHVLYAGDIKNRMKSLIQKCYAPILKDLFIEDGISNDRDIELYPSRLSDIFLCGKPIVVSGKYQNNKLPMILSQTNGTIRVSGICVDGQLKIYEFKKNRVQRDHFSVPLHTICAIKRLNEMTSTYWWNHKRRLKDEIIEMSMKENISSIFSSIVCYECDHKEDAAALNLKDKEITIIGSMNDLFGDNKIHHDKSGILESIGQIIDDDLKHRNRNCCYSLFDLICCSR